LDTGVEILVATGAIHQDLTGVEVTQQAGEATIAALTEFAVSKVSFTNLDVEFVYVENEKFYLGTSMTWAGYYSGFLGLGIHAFSEVPAMVIAIKAVDVIVKIKELKDAWDSAISYYNAWKGAYATVTRNAASLITTSKAQMNKIRGANISAAVIGAAIDIAVAVAVFIVNAININDVESLAFTAALAELIARIILAIILAIIAATVIGALILAVISLIDNIISIICSIIEEANGDEEDIDQDVNQWVCGGITGAFFNVILLLIYDLSPMIDLEKEGRMEFAITDFAIVNTLDGMVVNNQLQVNSVITSNLYSGSPDSLGYLYEYQFSDENIKDADFEYRLQLTETAISRPDGDDWIPVEGRKDDDWDDTGVPEGKRFYQVFTPSSPYTFTMAGINQPVNLYLTEAFNMQAQECWTIPIPFPPWGAPVCYHREFDDTFHSDLGDTVKLDIFPATFDGFVDMIPSGTSGYQLSWDSQ
ncbi:MAG: hypothetical protein GY869_09950, partial [Planctomycetes bacterium]|nr:hypothetical protein [Planctomycetota bacterium]